MGTHSSTKVQTTDGIVVNMYRHYDGYYEGHGAELANFLNGIRLVNGIPFGGENIKIANGMDDLAAQIVAHFKITENVGGFYLVGLDRDEEYNYTIYEDNGTIRMKCVYDGKVRFDGTPTEFLDWKDEYKVS
mgnify:CR=1 FL=1